MAFFNQFSSLFKLPGAFRQATQSQAESERLKNLLAQRQASLGSLPKSSQGGLSPLGASPTPTQAQSPQPGPFNAQNAQFKALQESLGGLKTRAEGIQAGLQSFQRPVSSKERFRPSEERILGLLQASPEEEQLREKLASLQASKELAFTDIEGRPIPLAAMIGEAGRAERRGLALQRPLVEQLASLQARRQADIEAAKAQRGFEEGRFEQEQEERKRQEEATRPSEQKITEFTNRQGQRVVAFRDQRTGAIRTEIVGEEREKKPVGGTLTIGEARQLGLPPMLAGRTEAEVMQELQSPSPPPWFRQMIQERRQQSLSALALKQEWEKFRSGLIANQQVVSGKAPAKEVELENPFE